MLLPRASGQELGLNPLIAIKSYGFVGFKPLGPVPFPFFPGMCPEAISAGAGSTPAMAGVLWGVWIPQLPTGGPKDSGSEGSSSCSCYFCGYFRITQKSGHEQAPRFITLELRDPWTPFHTAESRRTLGWVWPWPE